MSGAAQNIHPNSLANLKSFQPGEVANPKGNNQWTDKARFVEMAEKILDEPASEGSLETKKEQVARVFVDQLLAGKAWAMREFLKRVWPETHMIEVHSADHMRQTADMLTAEEQETIRELAAKALGRVVQKHSLPSTEPGAIEAEANESP